MNWIFNEIKTFQLIFDIHIKYLELYISNGKAYIEIDNTWPDLEDWKAAEFNG